MASTDAGAGEALRSRQLTASSRHIVDKFESAYAWIDGMRMNLHPDETVATIAFTGDEGCRIDHLTWQDLVQLHKLFERLSRLEREVDCLSD